MKNWTACQRRGASHTIQSSRPLIHLLLDNDQQFCAYLVPSQECRGPISVVAPADCEGWQATCFAIELLQVRNRLGSCSCTERTFPRYQSCPWSFLTVLPRTDLDLFRNAVLAIALPGIALIGYGAPNTQTSRKSITEICGDPSLLSVRMLYGFALTLHEFAEKGLVAR